MKVDSLWIIGGLVALSLLACSSTKLSQEQYIALMTEVGCASTSEQTEAAQKIYAKHNITQEDVMEFRQKAGAEIMMESAGTIAQKVAECHGLSFSGQNPGE